MKQRYHFICCTLVALLIMGCSLAAQKDLKQAADVITQMLAPVNLSKSAFYAAYPDGEPSDFVSYIFSQMGSTEWPPSEEWTDELDYAQMKSIGQAIIPEGIRFFPRTPQPDMGKQIVVSSDDSRGVVIIEGYFDDFDKPKIRREHKLEKVDLAIGVREIFENNVGLGMRID